MTRRLLSYGFCISCALSLGFVSAPAQAANIAWKAAANGSWTVATNWNPAQVPGVNDVAIITVAGTYDVNINSNVSVNAISLGSSAHLKVNSVTLTTSTGITTGSASVLELNAATLSGGSLSLNGQLSSSGTSNVNVALSTATSSIITVGVGSLTVANGFTNLGLVSYPANGIHNFYVTNGTLVNAASGTISCLSTGALGAQLDNRGSVAVSGALGDLTLQKSGVTHSNSGSMTSSGGSLLHLNLSGSTLNSSGPLTADTDSYILVIGGTFHQTAGSVSGAGVLELISTTAATFVSNPTTFILYLAGGGIVFPSPLVNGATQLLSFGPNANVTAPQLTNQAGYTLEAQDPAEIHVTTFTNLGTFIVPRHLLLDGNVNLGPLSTIDIGIGGTQSGLFDQMVVTGAVTLNGVLSLGLENGFVPAPGDRFDVLTSPARLGWFGQVNGGDLGNDLYLMTDPATTSSDSHPYTLRAIHQKWTQINPVSGFTPVARRGASAVYMPIHNEVIIFGGQAASGQMLNDVWMLENPDGTAGSNTFWHQIPTTGTPPSPRKGHSAVYDAFNHRMIVFGGENDSSAFFSDVWVLDDPDYTTGPAVWTQFQALPGSPSRSGHAAGYNPTTNTMVVSQGAFGCYSPSGDLWTLDHANGLGTTTGWSNWSTSGTPPDGRRDAIYNYDVNGNRLLVYGGKDPCGAVRTDAFMLSNADGSTGPNPTWSPLGAAASPPLPGLYGAPGGYDPLFDRLVMFGGMKADGTTFSSSVFLLAGTRGNAGWAELPLPATRPAARAFHSMVYRPDGKRWIMFGGDANGQYLNDVWTLELDGDTPQVSGIGSGSGSSLKTRLLAFGASPSPNPSSHGMQFSVKALESTNARIAIYDALGRRVAELHNGPMTAGEHRFAWAGDVASGIYFVLVRSGDSEDIRRIVVAH